MAEEKSNYGLFHGSVGKSVFIVTVLQILNTDLPKI